MRFVFCAVVGANDSAKNKPHPGHCSVFGFVVGAKNSTKNSTARRFVFCVLRPPKGGRKTQNTKRNGVPAKPLKTAQKPTTNPKQSAATKTEYVKNTRRCPRFQKLQSGRLVIRPHNQNTPKGQN